jgi:hypothetical protein
VRPRPVISPRDIVLLWSPAIVGRLHAMREPDAEDASKLAA